MKIVHHPNGFLTVRLSEETDGSSVRLHAWDRIHPDCDIHQHRQDFTSTVIAGVMAEEIWEYDEDPAGDHEAMMVNCWAGEDSEYHVDVMSVARCQPRLMRTEEHKAGETYERDARLFHRIIPVNVPLVTLVRFGPAYQQIHTMIRRVQ